MSKSKIIFAKKVINNTKKLRIFLLPKTAEDTKTIPEGIIGNQRL